MTSLPDLPLVYDGDSFLIELSSPGERVVKITRILVFPDNVNSAPKHEKFSDLDSRARRAVINQINLRYPGRMVHT